MPRFASLAFRPSQSFSTDYTASASMSHRPRVAAASYALSRNSMIVATGSGARALSASTQSAGQTP